MRARYIFRMDDITSAMDWDRFSLFIDLFQKYKIKPLLGIVPENADPNLMKQAPREDFWEIMRKLRDQGAVEFAQHGYAHVYLTKNPGLLGKYGCFPQSEFAGLPYEEQYAKIKAGREILKREGLETNIWMAPSHTFDLNTLAALNNLGFTMVTDGIALYPYHCHGLLFVPQQMWKYEYLPMGIGTICLHANDLDRHFLSRMEAVLQEGLETVSFSALAGTKVTIFQRLINYFFKRYYLGRNRLWKIKDIIIKN